GAPAVPRRQRLAPRRQRPLARGASHRDRSRAGVPAVTLCAMDIGILVFPDVEELDFAGPWEAFGVWSRDFPDDGVGLRLIADTREPVRCHKGLRVLPDVAREEV